MACTSRVDESQIDIGFLVDIRGLLSSRPEEWYITGAWRNAATEQAGYDKWIADPSNNPKYTKPELSAHVGANFPDGKSRAVDVTLVIGGKDIWDYTHPSWQGLISDIADHPRLHSGANFNDPDHIEKYHWQRDKVTV